MVAEGAGSCTGSSARQCCHESARCQLLLHTTPSSCDPVLLINCAACGCKLPHAHLLVVSSRPVWRRPVGQGGVNCGDQPLAPELNSDVGELRLLVRVWLLEHLKCTLNYVVPHLGRLSCCVGLHLGSEMMRFGDHIKVWVG